MAVATLHTQRQAALDADFETELERTVRTLQRMVRSATPSSVSGDQARSLVDLFAQAERAASSGVALFAPVVVESGSYSKAGHGSAPEWLGSISGSSAGVAKRRLAAAERAASDPKLTEVLHDARLSSDQLTVVANAAVAGPEAGDTLLDLVEQGASHQELTDAAERLRAAARCRESELARRARVEANRHFRVHQDSDGGVRGGFYCDEVAWARVGPLVEKEAKERWRAAGSKPGDSLDAHRLDAFLDLLTRSTGSGKGARPHTLVIIDAEALRRGTTQGDELCEIEGIGPVSVGAATELISEGGLQYLVREGFDIRTVTKSTRVVTSCIDMALIVRDRTCVVPGCGKRLGLDQDHVKIDYSADGPTELANLVRLCPEHHALKTYGGWRIEGGPGTWKWIAPADPKSAGFIARARKLAAAKAKTKAAVNAKVTGNVPTAPNEKQNPPQRT